MSGDCLKHKEKLRQSIEEKEELLKDPSFRMKQYFGLVFYLVVFVILIPYILFKNKKESLMELYCPNTDLIALVLANNGGPFNSDIFRFLYSDSHTFFGYSSAQIINYSALLAVTFIIAHRTHKTKSLIKGWSPAFFMLIITYLFPAVPLNNFLIYLEEKLEDHEIGCHYLWFIESFLGLIIVTIIILFEKFMIDNFHGYVEELLKKMLIFLK